MSVTDRELEHARKRVADMTPAQLLTRLNRIKKLGKLHAFAYAVEEQLAICKSKREVKRYYFVLARINERRYCITPGIDHYLEALQIRTELDNLDEPVVEKVVVSSLVIQLPKIKKKVSRRNLGI